MKPEQLDELRDGVAYVGALLRDIHEAADGGELDADTQARWDEGERYITDAASTIQREEARAKVLEQAVTASHPGDGARDFQFQRKVDPTERGDVRLMPFAERRDKALALIERDDTVADLDDAAQRKLQRLVRRSDGEVATRALVTMTDEYRSAFMKICAGQQAFTSDEARALDEYRAMGIITAGSGGYGVPVVIDPTIILTDQGSPNPFWSIADVKTITTKDWKGVSAAGVTFAFETEAAAANDLSPTLAQPTIFAHRVQGFIPFSIEVGMDYPDFEGEMRRLLGFGYDEILLDKFTRGSGTGEPWGIFEACEQATSQVTVDTDAQLHAADVNKVWKGLLPRYRANASWLMHVDVNNEIQSLGDDKLSKQTVNLAAGGVDVLKGKPVYETPYAPEFTGTTGAASILVVGDFRNFVIAQRAGMEVEYVPHVFDTTTGTPTGQRGLFAWARVGADSVNDNAFRMLVNT
jgi:HK97 family phage major capsid protein